MLDAQGKVVGHYQPPSAEEIAALGNAESVMLGRRLLNETARLLPDNVGNDLNCNSCHMAEGKRPFGNHYFNTGGGAYPRYMPRPGKVIGLTERINGCLQRDDGLHEVAGPRRAAWRKGADRKRLADRYQACA
ncbi:hypothetical protein G6F32_014104 [Rhizopus arrhizus]|nr:hypothetical protein G6F32_014104 [Rhizopus arrhizus]